MSAKTVAYNSAVAKIASTLAVLIAKGRPVGSSGEVRRRWAAVAISTNGVIEREMNYTDIDEARAAAERLAEERA